MCAIALIICLTLAFPDTIIGTSEVQINQNVTYGLSNSPEDNVKYQQSHSDSWYRMDSKITSEEEEITDEQGFSNSSWYNNSSEIPSKSDKKNQQLYGEPFQFNNSSEMSLEDKMKLLRIEMVKLQILSQLGSKAPPPNVAVQSKSANEMFETLLSEDQEKEMDNGERLAIHATNDAINCSQSDDAYCRKFHFEINSAQNVSSFSLWVYRADRNLTGKLFSSIACGTSYEEDKSDIFLEQVTNYGWNEVEMPTSLLPEPMIENLNCSFNCSVEVGGVNIEDQGDYRPFLTLINHTSVSSRQRRDLSCDSTERCCLRPLTVSFSAIGFDFVVYPYHVELNMCTGRCRSDLRTNSHYQTAMMATLEKNPALQESLGVCASFCCKPKQLAPVMIFYNDSQGLVDKANITELTVVSCGCI